MKIRTVISILSILAALFSQSSFAQKSQCGGQKTMLIKVESTELYICHAPSEKINTKELNQWQSCTDGMFYLKNELGGNITETLINECIPTSTFEYKVEGYSLYIKHYFSEYPDFTEKEKIVERFDISNNKQEFHFIERFDEISKQEIEKSIHNINVTLKKPFNGMTYFKTVYTGFYKIRDYAETDPDFSLSIMNKFISENSFDGEVAEVASDIIEQIKLVEKAKKYEIKR